MQHGLAVESDHRDRARAQAIRCQKRFDRLGMDRGNHRLGLGKAAGTSGAIAELRGLGHGLPDERTLVLAVSPIGRRPQSADPFSIRIDQRHVNAVQ